MIAANLIILAFMLEPAEPITEQPWNYLDSFEWIEPRSLEEIEKDLERRNIRILEAKPDAKR